MVIGMVLATHPPLARGCVSQSVSLIRLLSSGWLELKVLDLSTNGHADVWRRSWQLDFSCW